MVSDSSRASFIRRGGPQAAGTRSRLSHTRSARSAGFRVGWAMKDPDGQAFPVVATLSS